MTPADNRLLRDLPATIQAAYGQGYADALDQADRNPLALATPLAETRAYIDGQAAAIVEAGEGKGLAAAAAYRWAADKYADVEPFVAKRFAELADRASAPKKFTTPRIALRPDNPDHPDVLDDVVVNDVGMFRAEMMTPRTLWLCCYLNGTGAEQDAITFHVTIRNNRLVLTVTEHPIGNVTYEEQP